jgi:Sec-independent protein translocase protein TatA
MFGLGVSEILVICAIGLFLLGLPGVARALGNSLKEFRKELNSD